ncbi:MAG: hypothetical protein A2046_07650 [Bacteroidetes bacterium GWA2_30_7]|nr:MAG: hypothetical protein A2046_07650 [Bacteroidetes bacterium GWA2_30_7]
MLYVNLFILSFLFTILIIPFLSSKWKGFVAIISVISFAVLSSIPAINALLGNSTNLLISGSQVTGEIPIKIDPLSAWFILTINFTFITGVIYGSKYMQAYSEQKDKLSLHWISYVFAHAGILAVCSVQNILIFMIVWEIMTVSAFLLVIFEGQKVATIRAGLSYLIQSHIVVLLLGLAFIWVNIKTGSYNFEALSWFAETEKPLYSFLLMLILFVGFGIKAGFVPLHTWLPYAHPAAPSHVSGVMSGVLIKTGIYGIIRMLVLLNTNYLAIGYFILTISVITGVYGVMLAIVQHNLKKLLAYHSIENIGIIGIGIGIGCIGIGYENTMLSVLGFSGALLHVLNHSLFKSLLFYGAGNIYQSAHSMNIEHFGGLIKRMPHTAFLFLIAALAICGLPPFNGFISEFIIYSGLFKGLNIVGFPYILLLVYALFGLALIGGLAILCFTKAFGTIFLGSPRFEYNLNATESHWLKLFPMYLIVLFIVIIGIFPSLFIRLLSLPIEQITGYNPLSQFTNETNLIQNMEWIGYSSLSFIGLSILIYFIRKNIVSKKEAVINSTWGCGYVAPNIKMQYTASSFVRAYRKIAEPILSIKKHKVEIHNIFPEKASHETHAEDKIEETLIDLPIRQLRQFLNYFQFLQNGKLQNYILYGMLFIGLLTGVPLFIHLCELFVNFLNKL